MNKKDVTLIVALMIVAITVLLAIGRDADQFISFLIVAIVPTVSVMLTGRRVEDLGKNVDQVVHNTNGRMTELIEVNRELITHLETAGVIIDPETLEKHKNYLPEHVE